MVGRLVIWSLRHRRWRHAINCVTMLITAAVVIVFVSVVAELVRYVRASADRELMRVLVMPKLAGRELPIALHPMLSSLDGVRVVQKFRSLGARHDSGASYQVVGEEKSGVELNEDLFPVDPAVLTAWTNERPLGAIVTEQTARDLRLRVGEPAEIATPYGPLKIKVVGLSRGGLVGQRITVHLDYLDQFVGNPGTVRYRLFTKPDDYERVAKALEERSRNSATPLQAVSAANFAANAVRRVATVPAVLGFLGLFLIVTTALTLANTTAIAIRERRVEIATLRVLGYRRQTIVRLLLGEVMIVGLVGGVLAIAITWFVFRNGVQLTPSAVQLLAPVTVGGAGIVAGVIASIVVPLAGALPSTLASVRVPLVQALRDSA